MIDFYTSRYFSQTKDLYDTTLTRLQTFKNLQEAEDYLGQHSPPGNCPHRRYRNF